MGAYAMVASSAMSFLGNMQTAKYAKRSAALQQQQIAEQKRMSALQSKMDEADTIEEARRLRQKAMAKAASMGQDISQSRSFMAFLGGEEESLQDEINRIRVNAQSRSRLFDYESSAARAAGSYRAKSSYLKAGRSLFEGADAIRKLR